MDDPARNCAKHPLWHTDIDGVGELGIGFMLLCFGLLQWMQVHTPRGSAWNQIYGLWVYAALMCAIIHYGSKAIKRRFTYPRTGFVEYRKRDTVWRPLFVALPVSMLSAVALVVALRSHRDLKAPAALLLGLVFVATYAYGVARAVRWKCIVAQVAAMGSLTIAGLPSGLIERLAARSRGRTPESRLPWPEPVCSPSCFTSQSC